MNSLACTHLTTSDWVGPSIKVWEHIPWDALPPSAKVDLGLWIFGFKPSVRLILAKESLWDTQVTFKLLFPKVGLTVYKDSLYLGKDKKQSVLVRTIDWLSSPHGEKMGELLGYPPCCSKHMAQFPETMIDEISALHNEAISEFSPHLLDTSEYQKGICLLSHVPCSLHCTDSTSLALSFLKSILETQGGKEFQSFKKPILKKYGDLLG